MPARRPVGRRDPHRHRLAPPARPRARRRRPRAGSACGSRASRRTRRSRTVGERRDEAREQVAVRHVQLEQVEARPPRPCAAARTNSSRTRSMSARVISRGTWLCGKYGSGDADDERPVPLGQRLVDPLPQQPRRALAAGVGELEADLRAGCAGARSRRSASRPPTCSGLYIPAQPGVIRPSRLTSVISAMTSAGAADRAAAEVHEVPVVRRAVLGRVLAHRRDHDPVRRAPGRAAGTA